MIVAVVQAGGMGLGYILTLGPTPSPQNGPCMNMETEEGLWGQPGECVLPCR